MVKTIKEIMASLPDSRVEKIQVRTDELMKQVEEELSSKNKESKK
mgnify:FL=1